MMPGILAMFEKVSASKGIVWADKLKHWKEEGQWHVEVY
jgi:sulfite reductase alpha subunit-like flavoprotein